ncbi:MAG: DUF4340 domain-containing protein [Pseudomonadota bacterium]
MNRRGLWTLIVVVIVLALGAALIVDGGSDTHGSSDRIGQPLLTGLTDAVTELSRIELRSRADTVTMVHSDDQWQVVEKGGYPVDFESLVDLLDTLTEVTIVEQKTARPANHQRLGVADPDSKDSQAVVVTLSTGDESVMWTLIVGESSTGGSGGSYVRLGSDPQVWLASDAIDVDEDPSGWIDTIITNVDSDDVQQVDVVRADGGVLTVRREEGAENLVVDDVPEGRELKYATVANELARSLTNIRMTDVRPSAGEPWPEAHQSTYRLLDGTDVVVLARQEGEEHWLRVDREATTLSAWEYKVASYTFEDFSKQIEDLLKPLPSEEEGGAT